MTENEAFQAAVEIVSFQARACEPPTLDTNELQMVVKGAQLATTWAANTAYVQGANVLPITPNGHRYACIAAGTSGATEPAWNQFPQTTTTDSSVSWLEIGLSKGFFDTDQATFDAWMLKLGKCTPLVQQSSAGQAYQMQQLFTHCRQMASYWEPDQVA